MLTWKQNCDTIYTVNKDMKETADISTMKSNVNAQGQDCNYDELLSKLNLLFEKQEILVSKESRNIVHGFGYSETNCVDQIGRMELPNVTKLAAELRLTRGAVSKIVKRLLEKNIITSYQLEENRKERYFKLTEKGYDLFEAHKIRHEIWENRDRGFLESVDSQTLEVAGCFLDQYIAFLQMKIEDFEKDKDCNY